MKINIEKIQREKERYPFLKINEGWVIAKILSDIRIIPKTGNMKADQEVIDIEVIDASNIDKGKYALPLSRIVLRNEMKKFKEGDTVLITVSKIKNYYNYTIMTYESAVQKGIIEN